MTEAGFREVFWESTVECLHWSTNKGRNESPNILMSSSRDLVCPKCLSFIAYHCSLWCTQVNSSARLATRIFMVQINSKIQSSKGFSHLISSYWRMNTHMEGSACRGLGRGRVLSCGQNSFHSKLSCERHTFIQDLTELHQKQRAAALISASTLKHLSVNRDLS